jgi:IclR family transcriptional regulator, KDG regulon repressor
MPTEQSTVLAHATAILDCFSIEKIELGVREAARLTNLSPSTAGRLMSAMKDIGILQQNPTSRAYSLGLKILAWSGVYMSSLDIRTIALPYMTELHTFTNETISLYILDGTDRVCVERMESAQNVRIVARVGRRLPLYAGSAGKAMLAFLPFNRQEEILNSTQLIPFTSRTLTDKEVLRTELEKVHQQGYAVSHGEWTLDAAGVAAPIRGHLGDVQGALTISGPLQRFTRLRVEKYAVEVVRVAGQISQLLGFNPVQKSLMEIER